MYYTFSVLKDGFGRIIYSILALCFMMKFQCNLRSIEDQSRPKNILSTKSVTLCFLGIGFLTTNIILRSQYEMENFTFLHFHILLNVVLIFVLFPKYVISQNQNLQLYVSVHHHHPPPVLPWQLPENFDSGSVKLIIVQNV